ncbi:MAG: 6-carboxytetrahydropterin synthase QueD [Exilispira sp.]|jgi:6-pyruvoyltetrahydropterin/6-carboxytetrahydropterin synthase|nr:6-carboxytetrahydropterin synthase QueD [Exilispira sp.]
MYRVVINDKFSSAHFLRNYIGKCENLHGHNYLVEVYVISKVLNDSEMVIDFTELKKITKDILNQIDHFLLNDIDFFKSHNPTSENIAYYIFSKINEKIKDNLDNIILEKVRVWETDQQYAEYFINES